MRTSRLTAMLFATALLSATLMGCPSWTPVKKGTCNPGRNWDAPAKQGSEWKAGRCQDGQ